MGDTHLLEKYYIEATSVIQEKNEVDYIKEYDDKIGFFNFLISRIICFKYLYGSNILYPIENTFTSKLTKITEEEWEGNLYSYLFKKVLDKENEQNFCFTFQVNGYETIKLLEINKSQSSQGVLRSDNQKIFTIFELLKLFDILKK